MAYHDKYYDSEEFKEILRKYQAQEYGGQDYFLDADELTDVAEYYHIQGDNVRSIAIIDEAIERYAGASGPLSFRARIALIEDNDPDLAASYAEQIDDKDGTDYYLVKSEILLYKGNVAEADAMLLEHLDELDEEERDDYVLDVSAIFFDYNYMRQAQQWLDLSNDSELDDYKELKARIALMNGNLKESEDTLNELIDANPFIGKYWNMLATAQFLQNRISDGVSSSEYAIAIDPTDDEAVLNKANGLLALGNFEKALDEYEDYVRLRPDDDMAEMLLGIAYLYMNDLDNAVKHLEQAYKKVKQDSIVRNEICHQLAYTLSRLGNYDKAYMYLDKCMPFSEIDKAEVWVQKGNINLLKNNLRAALQCFKEAEKLSNGDKEVCLRIIMSIYDNNYLHTAYRLFDAFFSTVPNGWTEGYAYFATCCKRLNRREEYRKYLKLAGEKNPQETRFMLGGDFPQGISPAEYYTYV